MMDKIRDILRNTAADFLDRSYVPYSGKPNSVVILLSDGTVVPGVRVECASFSLTISALQNAISTAALLLGDTKTIVAIYTYQATIGELPSPVNDISGQAYNKIDDHFFAVEEFLEAPDTMTVYDPFFSVDPAATGTTLLDLARQSSDRAHIPESDFPVGCVLITDDNRGIAGANVEASNWNDILCAERNVIGTAITYAAGDISRMYISAPKDVEASPCGACRQVMVELAQRAMVWMDRGENPPLGEPCTELLPYYFSGNTIQSNNRNL